MIRVELSHWLTGRCAARTPACRVGTHADACISRTQRRRVETRRCTQECVRHDLNCEVISAWRLKCRNRLGTKIPACAHAHAFFPGALLFYTNCVAQSLTITISDEAVVWVRRKAVEENTSVSRLVGEMLEREMRLSGEYRRAYEHWKSTHPLAAAGAAERLNRADVHERR